MSDASTEGIGLFPQQFSPREGVVLGKNAERNELWRRIAEQRGTWERIVSSNDHPVTAYSNGVRAIPARLTLWEELGFLRRFKHTPGEERIPVPERGIRVEPSVAAVSKAEPYLVAHSDEEITGTLLDEAGLEWSAIHPLDCHRRVALITGMFRELSQRVLALQRPPFRIDPLLASPLGSQESAREILAALDLDRLFRQIASVTGCTRRSAEFPIVPAGFFGWAMRSHTRGMKFVYDKTTKRFRFISHDSVQEKLGVKPEELLRYPDASRELLSHEFAHRRTRWMWNNPLMIEAVPNVANALVARQFGEAFSDHVTLEPRILLALDPRGNPMDAPGFDVGDNADYSTLGAMGDLVIRMASYHLFRIWLEGKRRNWQTFMDECDQPAFGGNSPEKGEFLQAMESRVPGFRERFLADPFTAPAQDGTYVVFLPNAPRGDSSALRRGALYHFRFRRNLDFGMSQVRANTERPNLPTEFDFSPGSVVSFPLRIRYQWHGRNPLTVHQKVQGDYGSQNVYPWGRLREASVYDRNDDPCAVTVILPPEVAGSEMHIDLGMFSGCEQRQCSADVCERGAESELS